MKYHRMMIKKLEVTMATQNLVSASLTAETHADVLDKLAAIQKSLGFLLTLKTDQKQSLFKVGNGYTPFV